MPRQQTALIIGASRGLGLELAREYIRRGWQVIATVRDNSKHGPLHALQQQAGAALEIDTIDMAERQQIVQLARRLAGRSFDLLFVNAGVTNDPQETIAEVSDQEFTRVMLTNALSPLRVIEALIEQVRPDGQVAVMSSELASLGDNQAGGWEVYRASKAALNMLMTSLVVRRANDSRGFLVVAPGWVRTDMGGPDALLDVQTSIPGVIDAIAARKGEHQQGLVFVNYQNRILPW